MVGSIHLSIHLFICPFIHSFICSSISIATDIGSIQNRAEQSRIDVLYSAYLPNVEYYVPNLRIIYLHRYSTCLGLRYVCAVQCIR